MGTKRTKLQTGKRTKSRRRLGRNKPIYIELDKEIKPAEDSGFRMRLWQNVVDFARKIGAIGTGHKSKPNRKCKDIPER